MVRRSARRTRTRTSEEHAGGHEPRAPETNLRYGSSSSGHTPLLKKSSRGRRVCLLLMSRWFPPKIKLVQRPGWMMRSFGRGGGYLTPRWWRRFCARSSPNTPRRLASTHLRLSLASSLSLEGPPLRRLPSHSAPPRHRATFVRSFPHPRRRRRSALSMTLAASHLSFCRNYFFFPFLGADRTCVQK